MWLVYAWVIFHSIFETKDRRVDFVELAMMSGLTWGVMYNVNMNPMMTICTVNFGRANFPTK